ncbi:DUF3256 family protein [Dysgonomonas sp. 216]|uniref:DUF3256 family protein n=1 Tax=Dysgonomonas sp. 216 TaxID=2302934 RepID=UPI0013D003B4|nr:DUF3256 family protein [Dysgonomonas sp. 216]NDW17366.1 DUF3256 family protein [Dysgonomonas sp. 216]
MKRLLFAIFFLCVFSITKAQDITSVFLSAPKNILYGIDAERKDKLIASPTDTTNVEVLSDLEGTMKRLAISDDYISLQTSKKGSIQIKLLSLVNDSKIICVINTVCGKVCDSYIRFYTTQWQLLPDNGMLFPKLAKDWIIKSDADRLSDNFKNAISALDMLPVKMELNGENANLKLTADIKGYLSEDDYKNLEPFLIESEKTLNWNKIAFSEK